MFERNRVDSKPVGSSFPVEIELLSGEKIKGRLQVPAGHAPLDALNSGGGFIEFVPFAGEARYVAKSTIASLALAGAPREPCLNAARSTTGDDFDPHAILGVSVNSSWDEIRQAYVQLAKIYHPDKFAGVAMPTEVSAYLETMARRINAAFSALDTTQRVVRTVRAAQTQPIYTSYPRT